MYNKIDYYSLYIVEENIVVETLQQSMDSMTVKTKFIVTNEKVYHLLTKLTYGISSLL